MMRRASLDLGENHETGNLLTQPPAIREQDVGRAIPKKGGQSG
jgi:hypothetical protein